MGIARKRKNFHSPDYGLFFRDSPSWMEACIREDDGAHDANSLFPFISKRASTLRIIAAPGEKKMDELQPGDNCVKRLR